ncbi:heat shock 70 kDa protein 12A-like isoform X2 [Ostrea edulis]|uniref:heat shock 70 kDa protein 12A-like isoform X2 n=1 Tax=Ostrea edulis TaxID=37623 RepID=UPI0024AFDFC1|nr:heat shock 70 kDa protein 12A-like isoform X2 [Ostrea edulis]
MGSDSERNYLVVAAIDFGTTYSGFAYSFRNDPLKINSPGVWYTGDSNLASYRTPTCLLLNPDRTFHSFGFKAENKYAELCTDETHHEFYYFEKFKMELYNKAGIPSDQLMLALEPEAASVYCLKVTAENMPCGEGSNIKTPGHQYLVADLGGGTADFGVHEVNEDGNLTELYSASGGPYGGDCVNVEYLEMLEVLFGKEAIENLKNNDLEEYLITCRGFENKKRIVSDEYCENFRLKLPAVLLENCDFETLNNKISSFYGKELVSLQKGKLKISPSLMKTFFDKSIGKIKEHILNVIKLNSKVKSVLLVGGYGGSNLLQSELKRTFPEKTIIMPQDSDLTVVKGAVLFGYYPVTISCRKMRFSYGVEGYAPFEKGKHPEGRKITNEFGEERCEGAFDLLIAKNTTVPTTGLNISRTYCAATSKQNFQYVDIYYTEEEEPVIVDGKCTFMKRILIPLSKYCGWERAVVHDFTFGMTELKHQAMILETGECVSNTFDLL